MDSSPLMASRKRARDDEDDDWQEFDGEWRKARPSPCYVTAN
jgi:hypothetical protein